MALDREDGTNPESFIWSRRNLLSLAGWGAALGGLNIGILAWVRMMYPRVLFEPPTRYKIGYPREYTVNAVNDKWIKAYRFWVVRTGDRFLAVSAICRHLGCTARYLNTEDKFKCPCHGSGYRGLGLGVNQIGVNFEGPAPAPLWRHYIALADDGQIEIDTSVLFAWERAQWDMPNSSLPYVG